MMKLVGTASVDDQRAFRDISPTCVTCLTGFLKKSLTKGTEFTGVKCLMWIVAIGSVMNATSKHVPRTMSGHTSCQVAVAFVVFLGFCESNRFSETICDNLFEFPKGC